MHIIIDFKNAEEYENEQHGIIFEVDLTENEFDHLLDTLDCYIEDYPNYHCRVRNDADQEFFICLTVENR